MSTGRHRVLPLSHPIEGTLTQSRKMEKINSFSGISGQMLNPYSCRTWAGSRSVYCSCFNRSRRINAALISFTDFNELSLSAGREWGLVLAEASFCFVISSHLHDLQVEFAVGLRRGRRHHRGLGAAGDGHTRVRPRRPRPFPAA